MGTIASSITELDDAHPRATTDVSTELRMKIVARLKVTTQPRARRPQLNDSPMSGDTWGSNVVLFTNLTTSITESNELIHVTATEILETLKHKIKMPDAFALSYVHGVHSPIITWSWTHNVITDSLFCPSL